MIVEVSLGTVYAMPYGKQVSHCVFGGGLPHRASDADGGFAPQLADGGSERLQGDERVVNGEQARFSGVSGELIFADDGGDCSLAKRFLDKVVPVEALTLHCKK